MGQPPVLLISDKEQDARFWRQVSSANGLPFTQESDPEKIAAFLGAHPKAFVFWDANPAEGAKNIEEVLTKYSSPARVFAVSDDPINRQPDLAVPPVFGHHIFRRYEGPAPFLYSKLISAAMVENPSGLLRYFPEGSKLKEMELLNSSQKKEALGTIDSFLSDLGVNTKLVNVGVDAADELLMNAIFDAPHSQAKGFYRRDVNRALAFGLSGKERVNLRVAACDDFVGISVTDHFGSLKREVILKHLCQNYRTVNYIPPKDELSAGLGLHRINQLALALLFVSIPGKQTEVMVFFSNSKSYREFRLGFCFFSIFSG